MIVLNLSSDRTTASSTFTVQWKPNKRTVSEAMQDTRFAAAELSCEKRN